MPQTLMLISAAEGAQIYCEFSLLNSIEKKKSAQNPIVADFAVDYPRIHSKISKSRRKFEKL